MTNLSLPLQSLRSSHRQPCPVHHEDNVIARLLANYVALLDTTVSILVTDREPIATAAEDMAQLATNGLVTTDLNAHLTERNMPKDLRSTERDYGYVAFTTSGTSGNPKVVLYAKITLLACAAQIAKVLELHQASTATCYAKPSLAYGLSVVHSHYLANSKVIFRRPRTDPFEFQREVASLPEPRFVYLLPLHATQLTYGETYHPDLKAITFVIAGAMLPETVATKLSARYPNAAIANMYGQSELGPRIAIWKGPLSEYREGVVGRALPGVAVQIESMQASDGVIWVASPYRMLRYLRGSAPHADGLDATRLHWMRTGDLGFLDATGNLVVTGRNSGYANVAGELVSVSAIESVVRTVEEVALCSVAVEQHPTFGEVPLVRILPAVPGADTQELIRRTRTQLQDRLGRAAALCKITVLTDSHTREKV